MDNVTEKKVTHFIHLSHNDMDGYGPMILSKLVERRNEKEGLLKDAQWYYINVAAGPAYLEKLKEIAKRLEKDPRPDEEICLMITDLALTQEVLDLLTSDVFKNVNITYYDHHVLQDVDTSKIPEGWIIESEHEGIPTCATAIYFRTLNENLRKIVHTMAADERDMHELRNIILFLESVVDNIRYYDTWEWKAHNYQYPKYLNMLFNIYGGDGFVDLIISQIEAQLYSSVDTMMTDDPVISSLLKAKIHEEEAYIEKKLQEVTEIRYTTAGDFIGELQTQTLGAVFADKYISELGNRICEANPAIDIAAIINGPSISFRTIKDDVDCAKFARRFGKGGGHKKASGCTMPAEKLDNYVRDILYIFTDIVDIAFTEDPFK